VIGKYIFDLFSLFDSIHDVQFFCLLSFSSWLDTSFDRRGHHMQVNVILGNLLWLHYPRIVVRGAGRTVPVTIWHDYARAPDARYGNAQGVMKECILGKFIYVYNLCHLLQT
jgi:hypothetical protein